jgi:hypothetical protein
MGENMRVLVHSKSNLAPNGAPIAFRFDSACGFGWQGEYDINVDDLFNNTRQPHESQFDKAKQLIVGMLSSGYPVEVVKIMQMAERQGISEKTIKRAKAVLGVNSVKRNGQWFWEMPFETQFTEYSKEGQEGQDANMTSLTLLSGKEEV